MDVPKPCKVIGVGTMDVPKPYKFIRFGAMDALKPYNFMKFGAALPSRAGYTRGPRYSPGPSGAKTGPPCGPKAGPCTPKIGDWIMVSFEIRAGIGPKHQISLRKGFNMVLQWF